MPPRLRLLSAAALLDLAPRLGLDLGWRKVFFDGGPMTIGVGLTFDR